MFENLRWSDIFKASVDVAEKVFEGFSPSEPIGDECDTCGESGKKAPKIFYSSLGKEASENE